MKKKLIGKSGFTVAELVVVVSIIAILVLLATPYYQSKAKMATETLIRNDVKAAEKVFEVVKLENRGIIESWEPSNSEVLTEALIEARIYDETGVIEILPEQNMRIIPSSLVRTKAGSTLNGVFYVTEDENVYYVHDKRVTDRVISVIPDYFNKDEVKLAPFVYYQEQAKAAGSEKSTEEILEDYLDDYYIETPEGYEVKPGKEAEIQLYEDGMKAMLEERPYERFTEVSTAISRDFANPCSINYLPTEPYKRVLKMSSAPSTGLTNTASYTWDTNQSTYRKASDLGWIKYEIPNKPNIFLAVRRTSTASRITYEMVSSSNQRRTLALNNTGVGYAWYGSTYAGWSYDANGNYVIRLISNSNDSMGTYTVPAENVLCAERPPVPIKEGSALQTNTPLTEVRNSKIVEYFKKKTMTTQEKINAMNNTSGGGLPHHIFSMIR